jgi:hypothetical protein
MTFDSRRGCVVLFGGLNEKTRMGDTWEVCRDTWKLVKSEGPPARILGAMTYDTRQDRTVLFGGSVAIHGSALRLIQRLTVVTTQ